MLNLPCFFFFSEEFNRVWGLAWILCDGSLMLRLEECLEHSRSVLRLEFVCVNFTCSWNISHCPLDISMESPGWPSRTSCVSWGAVLDNDCEVDGRRLLKEASLDSMVLTVDHFEERQAFTFDGIFWIDCYFNFSSQHIAFQGSDFRVCSTIHNCYLLVEIKLLSLHASNFIEIVVKSWQEGSWKSEREMEFH